MSGRRIRLTDEAKTAAKAVARAGAATAGRATAQWRMMPDLLIVGAQRCGTTSLFRALADHPHVVPPLWHKGVHHFDTASSWARGTRWYQGHFPLNSTARRAAGTGRALTLEASPYYMFHPAAPQRIVDQLPGAQVVVLLRDPVQRAWSAFKQESGRGFEHEPFERALELEPERLAGEVRRLQEDPTYASFSHQHHAYTARGRYAEQIQHLHEVLGRDRVLVLMTDELFGHDRAHWMSLLAFLDLAPWDPGALPRANSRPSGPMPETARRRLVAAFADSDRDLEQLLGRPLPWTSRR